MVIQAQPGGLFEMVLMEAVVVVEVEEVVVKVVVCRWKRWW